jgi:hypothetical protein
MVGLLLIGFIMLGIAVAFSIAELNHYIKAVNTHKYTVAGLFLEWKKLVPFLVDFCVTVFLASFLGFGSGVVGGITGVFASNCISGYIWYTGHIKGKIKQTFAIN